MKVKFYIIIPIVAFVLIFANALFGYMIFDSQYDQDINKYSIYVHLQPEWNSYPGNILFDVTTVWDNPNPIGDTHDIYYDPDLEVHTIKEHNYNQLQNIRGKSFVELKHEFSDCTASWKPILYKYALDTIGNQLDYISGNEISGNTYPAIYPSIQNQNYDSKENTSKLSSGYVQFIPICTAKDSTSYIYSVKTNDNNHSFDVFFIPTESEIENYVSNPENFNYYEGCFGKNYQSFNGKCENVGKESGLLISLPDELDLSLTKVTVSLHEKS